MLAESRGIASRSLLFVRCWARSCYKGGMEAPKKPNEEGVQTHFAANHPLDFV
jgi:hypothetical protein